jgi:hypothetical protein
MDEKIERNQTEEDIRKTWRIVLKKKKTLTFLFTSMGLLRWTKNERNQPEEWISKKGRKARKKVTL